jgi:endogenous inhibitor of DNA gyrase (YacG/DUF329 family)
MGTGRGRGRARAFRGGAAALAGAPRRAYIPAMSKDGMKKFDPGADETGPRDAAPAAADQAGAGADESNAAPSAAAAGGDATSDQPAAAMRPCPICRKPAVQRYRPFCSKRCADIDLNRWLSGAYAIPVVEDEDEDGGVPEEGAD